MAQYLRNLALLCLVSRILIVSALAQQGRVIHLWVDPHYGNDVLAASNALDSNPSCAGASNGCVSGECLPNDIVDPNQPGSVLLHAPWAFRTVTAAIAYIPALPVTSSVTGLRWDYAIIHCLPGLYASTADLGGNPGGLVQSGTQYYHRPNGLVANGETFPIRVPDRVSIQGASAMNTVFFGNYVINGPNDYHCFEYGTAGAVPSTGVDSFINSLAICGFTWSGAIVNNQIRAGCAIYLGRDAQASPTVANCFIYCNHAGVVLDSPYMGGQEIPAWHRPVFVNNTIAWNRVGIWNGNLGPLPLPASIGRAAPVLLNNIIDASPPFANLTDIYTRSGSVYGSNVLAQGVSCFEGLSQEDLLVLTTGGSLPPVNQNFNAYQNSTFELNVAIGALPPTVSPDVAFLSAHAASAAD